MPRPLLAQLPSEEDDRAQVLGRDGETELGDELAAPVEVLVAQTAHHHQAATATASTMATLTRSTGSRRDPHNARSPRVSSGPE